MLKHECLLWHRRLRHCHRNWKANAHDVCYAVCCFDTLWIVPQLFSPDKVRHWLLEWIFVAIESKLSMTFSCCACSQMLFHVASSSQIVPCVVAWSKKVFSVKHWHVLDCQVSMRMHLHLHLLKHFQKARHKKC